MKTRFPEKAVMASAARSCKLRALDAFIRRLIMVRIFRSIILESAGLSCSRSSKGFGSVSGIPSSFQSWLAPLPQLPAIVGAQADRRVLIVARQHLVLPRVDHARVRQLPRFIEAARATVALDGFLAPIPALALISV